MRALLLALVPLLLGPASLQAQGLYARSTAATGLVTRGFFFQPGLRARTVAQVTMPVAVAVPVSRAVSVEVATGWAWTRLTTYDGAEQSLAGVTDTEMRVAYALGRDRALLTMVANLPTGRATLDAANLAVVGAIGSNFLAFPVSSYGSAASVTMGGVVAQQVRGINLGLGLSARMSGSWAPFDGVPVDYKPGVETRAQLAGDAIVGRGRVSAGVTFSTFGADGFSGTLTDIGISQAYQSGNRWIGELAVVHPLGPGTLTAGLWDFYRGGAEADGAPVLGSEENIVGLGGTWRMAAAPGLAITPGLEWRRWSRDGGTAGRLMSLGIDVDVGLGPRAALMPQLRTDFGYVNDAVGASVAVQGWTVGLLGQFDF